MRARAIIAVIAAGLLTTLADGRTADAATGDLEQTWERAEIWIHPLPFGSCNGRLDDVEVQSVLKRLPAETKIPTVIYMHGCAAQLKPAGWTYARWLVKAGYAVIMPESFARGDRPKTCDPWRRQRFADAPTERVHAMRLEEIGYALEQARKLPWVDQENLFLMGHDEGGNAVAAFAGDGFKARVISSATCSRGIGAAPGTPILAAASDGDDLLGGAPADSCARLGDGQGTPVESLVLKGYIHDLSGLVDAREKIIDFLGRHNTRPPPWPYDRGWTTERSRRHGEIRHRTSGAAHRGPTVPHRARALCRRHLAAGPGPRPVPALAPRPRRHPVGGDSRRGQGARGAGGVHGGRHRGRGPGRPVLRDRGQGPER
jgi:dienelactone hydrolase